MVEYYGPAAEAEAGNNQQQSRRLRCLAALMHRMHTIHTIALALDLESVEC